MATCCEIKGRTVPVKIWSSLESVESAALAQLRNIASLPWVYHHVAAMADVHLGVGATIAYTWITSLGGDLCVSTYPSTPKETT